MSDALRLRDAQSRNLSRSRLRGSAWTAVSHGVYAPSGGAQDLATLCGHVSLVLPPGSCFSHFTAAQLHTCWLPQLPGWLPVMATLPPQTVRPERGGLYVARSRALSSPPIDLDGLTVIGPAFALGQLAADLGLIDLVVAIDSLLYAQRCTIADIEASIRPRQRGLPTLRRALVLCDDRSESPGRRSSDSSTSSATYP